MNLAGYLFLLISFWKQFAHLEEHYGKCTATAPLEMQQS
ncbi:hypothetical protein M8C21_033545 [Ambrosia artemisiifolia]|uniref:Uncharacterized protein n=1 Tax=Ambrosia artemisiifolia TaxID=4212 RepID=A0AAD5D4R0_AMBAR|nr:hypothetical protein M8C21_033545 [Ambrosia artemisiifolia]